MKVKIFDGYFRTMYYAVNADRIVYVAPNPSHQEECFVVLVTGEKLDVMESFDTIVGALAGEQETQAVSIGFASTT